MPPVEAADCESVGRLAGMRPSRALSRGESPDPLRAPLLAEVFHSLGLTGWGSWLYPLAEKSGSTRCANTGAEPDQRRVRSNG